MTERLPDACLKLLKRQCSVIASWQTGSVGLAPDRVRGLLRTGRWQRVGHGVYAAFTGRPSRDAMLWAAVLRTGPLSVLSHETAGGLYGIVNDVGTSIHVTIPHRQHLQPVPGLVIHRTSRFLQVADPGFGPPRTQIDETVLDLAEGAATFDDVVALLARSCQRRLTTPYLLNWALEKRPRVRWRREISLALQDVADGVNSVLEFRYLHDVERAHGLPASERQAPAQHHGHGIFRDVWYRKYGVLVELDGKASHPDEQRWKDKRRDNAAAVDGCFSLRYGWADIHERACETASEVGTILTRQGWNGTLRRCGPACRLPFP
jgi:hypothetical protein